jgi:hypothetical protein
MIPATRIANIPSEMSWVERVRHVFTTWGTNATVVRVAASKPSCGHTRHESSDLVVVVVSGSVPIATGRGLQSGSRLPHTPVIPTKVGIHASLHRRFGEGVDSFRLRARGYLRGFRPAPE